MKYKKKIAAVLSSLLLLGTPCFAASTTDILSAVSALMSAQQQSGNNKIQSLLSAAMLMNGGISLADGVKYSWIDSGEVKSFVQCSMSTTKPEINQEVEAVCSIMITDKKYMATPMPLQMFQTFTSTGKQTMSGMFMIYKVAEEKENGQLVQIGGTPAGNTFVTITFDDIVDPATVLGDSPDNKANWKTATDPVTGEEVLTVSGRDPTIPEAINNDIHYDGSLFQLVDDGTNSEPLPNPTGRSTIINVPEGYGSNPDAPTNNGGGLPNVGNDTDREHQAIDDLLNGGSNLNNGTNNGTTTGNNIADYLNRALDDLGAFNSGDDDWKNSNEGNDGEASLDDYFGGVDDDDSDAPGGLTDDVLGLGTSIYDEEPSQESTQEYAVVEDLPISEPTNGGETVVAEATDSPQSEEYGFGDLASIYQQGLAGLDATPDNGDSSNGGLLGAMSAQDGSSLGRRLQRLAGGDVSVVNNVSATASDQELFDLAKKELTGAGISLEDIKRGLTYSPNSAWTDPAIAWDFNRITTLMKKKKISLQPSSNQREREQARNNTLR